MFPDNASARISFHSILMVVVWPSCSLIFMFLVFSLLCSTHPQLSPGSWQILRVLLWRKSHSCMVCCWSSRVADGFGRAFARASSVSCSCHEDLRTWRGNYLVSHVYMYMWFVARFLKAFVPELWHEFAMAPHRFIYLHTTSKFYPLRASKDYWAKSAASPKYGEQFPQTDLTNMSFNFEGASQCDAEDFDVGPAGFYHRRVLWQVTCAQAAEVVHGEWGVSNLVSFPRNSLDKTWTNMIRKPIASYS